MNGHRVRFDKLARSPGAAELATEAELAKFDQLRRNGVSSDTADLIAKDWGRVAEIEARLTAIESQPLPGGPVRMFVPLNSAIHVSPSIDDLATMIAALSDEERTALLAKIDKPRGPQ